MFRRDGGETSGAPAKQLRQRRSGLIEIERDAPRPATILRVAGELEERGGRILELFKEVRSPMGQVVFPIHLLQRDKDFFVEVETGPWDDHDAEEAVRKAAVLRGSEHAEAGLEILSAYPVPREVRFYFDRSPAALLQLDLSRLSVDRPEASAELFREVGARHWGVDLDYEPAYLPLVEELLLAALDADDARERPPVSDELVGGLGSFLGETIRRNAGSVGRWLPAEDWSGGPVVEVEGFVLDPVGKARAFLEAGPEDSVAFYADHVLDELNGVEGESLGGGKAQA